MLRRPLTPNRRVFARRPRLTPSRLGTHRYAASQNLSAPRPVDRMSAAWRTAPGTAPDAGRDYLGTLELDGAARKVKIATSMVLPERVHGLLAERNGGLLAVGNRLGRFLLRCDASGQTVLRHPVVGGPAQRTLAGHVTPSTASQWLYTPETDRTIGPGWVSVRDCVTLRKNRRMAQPRCRSAPSA